MGAIRSVLITGGAGYVGSVLVQKLLERNYRVHVYDLCLFGTQVIDSFKNNPDFKVTIADIRNREAFKAAVRGSDAVIHLACISNDPSFELNPDLGKSINYDCFPDLVTLSKSEGVRRFIYASSSSVYGIKECKNVTEDLPLEPLTDYSKYKALCEDILLRERAPGFVTLILRPATVCGYSPRLRLDLAVNILTHHACVNRKIKVFGGTQLRPNIHIQDMTDLYIKSLEWPDDAIDGRIYNAGYENHSLNEIAETVRRVIGSDVEIETTPTDDLRSYHISSDKIKRELGFSARYSIADAVREISDAIKEGRVPNSMTDPRYYNIRVMKEKQLT